VRVGGGQSSGEGLIHGTQRGLILDVRPPYIKLLSWVLNAYVPALWPAHNHRGELIDTWAPTDGLQPKYTYTKYFRKVRASLWATLNRAILSLY
jgi:hypothetical protein